MRFLRPKNREPAGAAVQTARDSAPLSPWEGVALLPPEAGLYDSLRQAVPLVDAVVRRLLRLTGGFTVTSAQGPARRCLEEFCQEVPVGPTQRGLESFVLQYLDSLLTYGSAAGEMVLSPDGDRLQALYNAPLENLEVLPGRGPLEVALRVRDGCSTRPVAYPELVLFSALNPRPGQIRGESILSGLPFVSSVLLKIYQSMGQNFERLGALRYAVTYKPGPEDGGNPRETAAALAREWSQTMSSQKNGQIRDFVAVGDVAVRVIGGDCPMPDTEVPVRQMLEQIVAKLGLPPFLLGLNWSTTERMSRQQADFLTSELESYRRLLDPVIRRICQMELTLRGLAGPVEIVWEGVSLQDQLDEAQARLTNAQAALLEQKLAAGRKGEA